MNPQATFFRTAVITNITLMTDICTNQEEIHANVPTQLSQCQKLSK